MQTVSREELTTAVRNAWSAETSAAHDRWSEKNPALGQCAVTACVMQDYLGGDILNSVVMLPDGSSDSHYYNLIDREEVDLTIQQFPVGSIFSEGRPKTRGFANTRDYCLSFDATRQRYETLKARVGKALTPMPVG